MAKYHKYVFDHEKRKLIGAFEEMYKAEDLEGFDSWQNNDVRHLRLRLAMEILRDYNFDSVLELGCGKGTASQFLNNNNKVLGVDISPTAIEKAKASYPDIQFRTMDVMQVDQIGETFDLTTVMTVLAYIEDWPLLIEKIKGVSEYLLVVEYIPEDTIGMVKNFTDLNNQFERHFETILKLLLNDELYILFGKRKTL
jgi:SAM-dependent methyltransferase